MLQIILEVTYTQPRSGKEYTKLFGPVFGKKQANWLMQTMMRKRNVINIRTRKASAEEEV